MKILSTHSFEQHGNDCMIQTSIALMEDWDKYFVINSEVVSGWGSTEDITTTDFTDEAEAGKEYNRMLKEERKHCDYEY